MFVCVRDRRDHLKGKHTPTPGERNVNLAEAIWSIVVSREAELRP